MCHFYSGLLKRNHSGALQKYQEFDPTIQENCFSDTYGKSLSFLVVDEVGNRSTQRSKSNNFYVLATFKVFYAYLECTGHDS
jgi:hypothetical protein